MYDNKFWGLLPLVGFRVPHCEANTLAAPVWHNFDPQIILLLEPLIGAVNLLFHWSCGLIMHDSTTLGLVLT